MGCGCTSTAPPRPPPWCAERQRHALSLIDPRSASALRLRTRLAGESDYASGQHAATLAALDEARRFGDAEATADALSLAHHCVLGPDHAALRHGLALELIGVASQTGRRSDLLMGLLWRTVDLLLDGDPHAQRSLAELRARLALADHLAIGFVVKAIDVMLQIRTGHLAQAEALATQCAERGAAAGDADATGWYAGQLVAIRWFQGRIAELLPMLSELVHSPTLSAIDNSLLSALAVSAATAGDHRQATGALAQLTGRDLGDLPRSSSWLVMMYGVVEAAHLLADTDTAARSYELLTPFHRLPIDGQPRGGLLRLGAPRARGRRAHHGRHRAGGRASAYRGLPQPGVRALARGGAVAVAPGAGVGVAGRTFGCGHGPKRTGGRRPGGGASSASPCRTGPGTRRRTR